MSEFEIEQILQRLGKSRFRNGFRLQGGDRVSARTMTASKLHQHATEFVANRLGPKNPLNDGKQTPMRGHPVFVAQHATATCCRSCLEKWLGIEKERAVTEDEQEFIVRLILEWIRQDLEKSYPESDNEPKGEVQQTLFDDTD